MLKIQSNVPRATPIMFWFLSDKIENILHLLLVLLLLTLKIGID